jgi:hypothetical protein
MKLFGRGKNKENVEKLIVIHYAKYIGLLSSNKSYPLEEGAYVNFYEDRVVIDLLKSKRQTVIPYKNMTEIREMDDYTCILSSPITIVTVFIVSHFSHLAPKSDIFQKAVGCYDGVPPIR